MSWCRLCVTVSLSKEYGADMDVTRFRSFAERYVIERASTFKGETDMEDAWNAVERAKTIYKHIENVASVEDDKDRKADQASVAQAPQGSIYSGTQNARPVTG